MNIQKLESIDSGSNYKFQNATQVGNFPRSAFDLSHRVTTTLSNAGPVYPINFFEACSGDDHDISARCLLRVMPQVVPLYSRQRQYIYAIYSRSSELWDNYGVFSRNGRTGTVTKTIPVFTTDNLIKATSPEQSIQPGSLGDMLGLPIGMTRSQVIGASINMLPFMMYLRFWRDYIINPNFRNSDTLLFPDDDSRFRLGDDGNVLSFSDNSKQVRFDIFSTDKGIDYNSDNDLIVRIAYHEYPSDRFTSALSSPQRGNEQYLEYSNSGNISFNDVFKRIYSVADSQFDIDTLNLQSDTDPKVTPMDNGVHLSQTNFEKWLKAWNKAKVENLNLKISLNALRELSVNQTILEKLAKTDGSYTQFGLTMYGVADKTSYDYNPTLIGGTFKDITFTEVLQNSPTYETVDGTTTKTPLGTYGGHGINGINNDYLGHITCDANGYIMLLSCIMPDIYYNQGIEKKFTNINQSDMFLPERAKLGMIPILNKEVYYAGNNGTSSGDDNYLWAYGNIYDDLRFIPNRISGKIGDSSNKSFYPFTQARHFNSLPNWSKEFVTASDIRKDYLASASEDAYSADFYFDIRTVRQLPYQSVPASII